jgi:phosphopantothenoylcysteine decarboxylase/phosphopantothenate--cysteine ligase
MTRSSKRFIGPATFRALTGIDVVRDLFDPRYPLGAHIELARAADVMCIAPATANLMAKAALGMADDLLSTLLLSFAGPKLLAPAMNTEMWANTAVQRNVEQLKSDGYQFIGPDSGWLSCRDRGAGRMAEPDEIRKLIIAALKS